MFKKIIFILICIFYITGCSKKNDVGKNINTIIEENKNILIGINYPITNIERLDNIIKNDIENEYNSFKDEYENFKSLSTKSELNIDYTFNIIDDNYINITIHFFISSSKLDNPINKINTYVFDIKNNKLVKLNDLINKENLKKLIKISTNKLVNDYKECIDLNKLNQKMNSNYDNFNLFTFDNEYINLYFNPNEISFDYCDIIDISIPFDKLETLIKLGKTSKKAMNYVNDYPVNKIIDPNKKVVALTFDDGPSEYTDEILDILHKNDAVATFFVIGNKVEFYEKTLKKCVKYGNEIGNHSYNHKWLTRLSNKEFNEQINKTQDIVFNTTGFKPVLLRPTYGSINSNIRSNTDLNIVMWTVDTMDWKYKNVNTIVKRATKNIKDRDIILMHDIKKRTVDAVKEIVPILKEKGYQFVTVSELYELELIRKKNE